MSHPILKIITSDGCQSYLIGCPTTRDCLLVDPKVGQENLYKSMLGRYGMKLVGVLDTHTHADHLSATTKFLGEDVPLYMSPRTQVQRPMRAVEDGAEIKIGELSFQVIEVPGHTLDSIALFGHGLVVTGDSLFIGGLARADFIGSDPALLYDSVQSRLMTLPDETLVLPGHGYNDILFSTIDAERRLNPCLIHADGAAYAASLDLTAGAGNSEGVNANLVINLATEPSLPDSPPNVAACCASPGGNVEVDIDEVSAAGAQAIHATLSSPGQWVDVRDPFEYEANHIAGTSHVPLSELGFHLDQLRGHDPLYISCRSGVRSMTAAKTLQRLGVATNPINVGGGILGWQSQGNPIVGVPAT